MPSVIKEEQIEEPDLNYWQPESLTPLPLTTNYNSYYPDLTFNESQFGLLPTPEDTHHVQCLPPTFQSYPSVSDVTIPPSSEYFSSTLTPSSYDFTPTQAHSFGYPPFNVDNYTPKQHDNGRIQLEVTQAAKTLFRKRNRTLMSWLNPGLSKAHLRFDTNSAWETLPQSGKDVFVAQVLGKLAPYASSLMVNPSLKPTDEPTYSEMIPGVNNAREYESTPCPPVPRVPKQRKIREKKVEKQKPTKRKVIYLADDEDSSGLVVDTNLEITKPKQKYKGRKQRDDEPLPVTIIEGECSSSSSCALSVEGKERYIKPTSNIATEEQPRIKRKYTKRKLVRKKYTRKAPKNLCCEQTNEEVLTTEEVLDSNKDSDDVDLWVELGNNDDFCKSIEMMTEENVGSKRKYTKRKLVRKKYTRKAPKNLCCEQTNKEVLTTEEVLDSNKDSDDVDLWVELGNNDDFCKSIEMMSEGNVGSKRKYTERKLVQKKYTRKAPKNLCCEQTNKEVLTREEVLDSNKDSDDVDLWVELGNNDDFCKSIEMMTEEDVERFWETIDDPNNLFVDLEVE